MPWRYNYYRRRPRRYWRRRFRRTFQRRRWRRHRRVRKRLFKRKLKRLPLTQWQPPSIRKLKIKGWYPLFACTSERLSNNNTMWLESIAPEFVPGGGGFSICNFSLQTLYSEHLKLHNWWTQTNTNYPLIRYQGVTLKLFKPEHVDYIFYYQSHYPMKASAAMYTSTAPSIMLLNNRKRIIKCKQFNKKTKPYTKLKIPPPSEMSNKWYFQRDIAQLPLLMTIATAASLDRTYINSGAQSTTVGFTTLNSLVFQNHSFSKRTTSGYQPKPNQRMFLTTNHSTDPKQVKIGDLIFLGNTNQHYDGTDIRRATQGMTQSVSFPDKLIKYLTDDTYWGNPFTANNLSGDYNIWFTNADNSTLKTKYATAETPLNQEPQLFVLNTLPLTIRCRYNPFQDDNKNDVYLLKIDSLQPDYDYHPPQKPELISDNLPLWACTWAYIDYQKKQAIYNNIDTTCICIIQSHSIDPKRHSTFIPIDEDFLHNRSPYRPGDNAIIPSDNENWHPKVAFQVQSLNHIACSGPFTAKLPKQISCEAHMQYTFHFKLGGSPAPMEVLTAPENQPKYPSPNNIITSTSLQSPTTPIEQFLYHFDQRRDQLTQKALKRIQTYTETETPLLQITDPTTIYSTPHETTQTSDSEDSEKETETPQQQLIRYRREQKLLRRGINQLLLKLAKLE
nr:MAG: ORF1 [TTV-like mini virus]